MTIYIFISTTEWYQRCMWYIFFFFKEHQLMVKNNKIYSLLLDIEVEPNSLLIDIVCFFYCG